MKGFVYIIQYEKSGNFYIGSTNDPVRRFRQYEKGYSYTSRRLGRFKVKLIQEYSTLKIARQIEYKLKSFKRRDFIEKIVQDGFIRIRI